MASKKEIKSWLEEGKHRNAQYMLVVSDTWAFDYFPVYVKSDESLEEKIDRINSGSDTRVIEVYGYRLALEDQLSEASAYHVK